MRSFAPGCSTRVVPHIQRHLQWPACCRSRLTIIAARLAPSDRALPPTQPCLPHQQAAQAQTEWALAATAAELERERGRTAELLHEQDALHMMSAYQEQAAQLLDFAGLAEKLEGELTLYPDGASARTVVASTAHGGQDVHVQAALAALGPSLQPGGAFAAAVPAAAVPNGGGSMQHVEAAGGTLGGAGITGVTSCGLVSDQPAVPAAALDMTAADSLELDEALAELADADLSLLLQQAQGQPGRLGGSGDDWLDALQWTDEPQQPQPPPQQAHQPQQQHRQQQPQPPPQQPQQQVQPAASPLQALVKQQEEKERGVREMIQRFFSHSAGTDLMAQLWALYPRQPPTWLLLCVAWGWGVWDWMSGCD